MKIFLYRAVILVGLCVLSHWAFGEFHGLRLRQLRRSERHRREQGDRRAWNGHFKAVFSEPRDHAYLPIYYASFWVDHAIDGKEPWIYHLINVLLHGLNAFLLALVLRPLLKSELLAFGAAAVFAVHPVLAESVVWASGRKDLISTTFMLLALLAGDRGWRKESLWRSAVLPALLFLLALFAKAMVFVLPLIVFLLLPKSDEEETKRGLGRFGPGFWATSCCSVFAVLVHMSVASGQGTIGVDAEVGHFDRAVGMLGALGAYATNLLLPTKLAVAYDMPFDGSFGSLQLRGLAILLLAGFAIWRWRAQASLWAIGLLWFLAALVPVNNLFPPFGGRDGGSLPLCGGHGLRASACGGRRELPPSWERHALTRKPAGRCFGFRAHGSRADACLARFGDLVEERHRSQPIGCSSLSAVGTGLRAEGIEFTNCRGSRFVGRSVAPLCYCRREEQGRSPSDAGAHQSWLLWKLAGPVSPRHSRPSKDSTQFFPKKRSWIAEIVKNSTTPK